MVAHRADHALAVLADHHRRVGAGENAVVARQQLYPVQVFQPGLRALDAVAGHAQVVARLLGGTGGQGSMGDVAPLALGPVRPPVPVAPARAIAGSSPRCRGPVRYVPRRTRHPSPSESWAVLPGSCAYSSANSSSEDGAELAHQLGVVGADQGGIARGLCGRGSQRLRRGCSRIARPTGDTA